MVTLRQIDSLYIPELNFYRSMKYSPEQNIDGIFIGEGEKVVLQILKSPHMVLSGLMIEKYYFRLKNLLESRSEHIEIFLATKEILKDITGYKYYQGVLLMGKLEHRFSLQEAWGKTKSPRFFFALDELANPENVGGIIRSAAAFGVQAVIVGSRCCSPWLRRSIRSSVGNVFNVIVVDNVDICNTFDWLRSKGMEIAAAHPHSLSYVLGEYSWSGKDLCLVVGNEGQGLSEEVLRHCSHSIRIPMSNEVDSLNVASSSAVFLYDIWRQRQKYNLR